MLQLVYISTVVATVDTAAILDVSRANNTRDRITGLLFCDGRRFLQALEGDTAMVERSYARIARDPRHRALVVLSRREVAAREFGGWAMAERVPGADGAAFTRRVEELVAAASPAVRATFDSFARLQRAA